MRITILWLAATAMGAAADISGQWTIEGDVRGNPVNLNCAVKQAADGRVMGKCTLNGGDSVDIVGEAKEDKIQFAFQTQGYRLEYAGEISGESMKGGILVAGTNGTFSGKRAAQ